MRDTLGYTTDHACRGRTLGMTFDAALKRTFVAYTVEMTAPESTTGGGARARQYIRLVSKDGVGVVIGCANTVEGVAELRTLGHTLALSRDRLGRELPIPPSEYLRFVDRATQVLTDFGLKVTVVPRDAAPASAGRGDDALHDTLDMRGAAAPLFGIIALSFAVAACNGLVEPETETVSDRLAETGAAAEPPPDPRDPEDPQDPPCPPKPSATCGSCSEGTVCCSASDQPCVGRCVPDCRRAPSRCRPGSACDDASGVCLFPPGVRPPPPPGP